MLVNGSGQQGLAEHVCQFQGLSKKNGEDFRRLNNIIEFSLNQLVGKTCCFYCCMYIPAKCIVFWKNQQQD